MIHGFTDPIHNHLQTLGRNQALNNLVSTHLWFSGLHSPLVPWPPLTSGPLASTHLWSAGLHPFTGPSIVLGRPATCSSPAHHQGATELLFTQDLQRTCKPDSVYAFNSLVPKQMGLAFLPDVFWD